MKQFPRLRYPLNTMGISKEDRLIILAYDILWKHIYLDKAKLSNLQLLDLEHDISVTLHELGRYIEHEMNLGGIDRFDQSDIEEETLF